MSAGLDATYLDTLWDQVLIMLKERLSGPTFNIWFEETKIIRLDEEARTLYVLVPSTFVRNWIEQRYTTMIQNLIIALTEQEYRIRFVTPSKEEETAATLEVPVDRQPVPTAGQTSAEEDGDTTASLIPRYTFETFVIGASNRFAHAACLAVSERPAQAYNPLFIYGGVGLGKTHLMHAIGHYVKEHNPPAKVRYLSSERFTNEFITAIRDGSTESFRSKYRSIDVLLIDDIQFLANKEQTQEEFFHTFNSLHEAGKQIVISSDRPPREIPTLEDRLRSRFEWGLITDIQPPDLETRIAILQRKAKSDGLDISENVLAYIADQIDSNIRELEGALIRVVAYSSLVNEDVTPELAQVALKDIIQPNRPRAVTVNQVQKVISDHFGLRIDDLRGKKRTRNIAFPRQIAMYLTRELTDMSLPRIGEAFGGRDHTTVMHACDRVAEELEKDVDLRATIDRLAEAIRTLM
ncbi:chromosomal replication initiator protein DnaA [Alicyclobacillus sacchari]|uniref:Chromosomal replication initiator protein DnaA n=1 Tax=Alicyclobacillus sacchari TaxID=392010 RepID=A0A4R8LGT7_9BACL|nr:chromosomal replication initiator protein DnaA [Alicyclobacillus sacchari]TDY42378.1 chromosomal replication initiator protein DnaA [Alicyclobacillus sacchari]GMA57313.1 chromosomal replication initiator protein DnaA [Alicyclobacillus sacchari]